MDPFEVFASLPDTTVHLVAKTLAVVLLDALTAPPGTAAPAHPAG